MKWLRTVLFAVMATACSDSTITTPPVAGTRDFVTHPTVEVQNMPTTLYAVSDIHGGYDRLVTLLFKNGVLTRVPAAPNQAEWNAGPAVLVIVGDMIDKGPQGLEVLQLLRALQTAATTRGGRVIALLGNHEAEFLAYPLNDLASKDGGIDVELYARSLIPFPMPKGPTQRVSGYAINLSLPKSVAGSFPMPAAPRAAPSPNSKAA